LEKEVNSKDDVLGNSPKEFFDCCPSFMYTKVLAAIPDTILGKKLYSLFWIVFIITYGCVPCL